MLASQIIDNGYHDSKNMVGGIENLPKPHSLGGTVLRYLGKELTKDKSILQQSFIGMHKDAVPTQEQIAYALGDVEFLIPLYHTQQEYIKERGLSSIVLMENKLTPVLVKIEFRGCLIDRVQHKKNIDSWRQKIREIEEKLDGHVIELAKKYPHIQGGKYTNKRKKEELIQLDLFGGEGYVVKNLNLYNVNYSSPKQIDDLFTRVGAIKPTDDDGKISFGENAINTYINTNPSSVMNDFSRTLLEYREYDKLLGTYGQKLFNVLDADGRLRTSYGQCWTDTGRLTSSELIKGSLGTNLANIPKRADVRSVFIPDPGYSFVDSDMTGQEVLIAGDFAKEPVLMKAFKEGFDHHSFLASISYSLIFKKPTQIVDKNEYLEVEGHRYNMKFELRQDHKSCLFAKFYGGGKMRVMNVLNRYLVNHQPAYNRLEIADQISRALNNALPKLTRYLRGVVDQTKKDGYTVANKLGRRRYYDDVEKMHGEIMNLKIQATGADSIKIALINIDKWFMEKSKELDIPEEELGWISMTVYDQNLMCLNDKYLHLAPELQDIMAQSITYFLEDLKGSSDLNIRKAWAK